MNDIVTLESLRILCKDATAFQELLLYLQQSAVDSAVNFEKVFHLSPDSILIVRLRDGLVLKANPAAARISGIAIDDMIGKVAQDIWADPEIIKRVQRSLDRYGRVNNLEISVSRGNEPARVINISAVPIRYEGENCLLSMTRDMSAIVEIHERLQEVQKRYEAIVETQSELIIRYLPDTVIIFANEAYYNYMAQPQEDLLGQSFLKYLDENQVAFARSHIETLIESKERITHEMRVQQGIMQGRWIQWTDTPILNQDGEVIEIQAVGRDISDRKEAELALQERETQINLMLDNVQNVVLAVFDRDLRYTVLRGHLLQGLGYDPEAMLGQHIYANLPPEIQDSMIEHSQAVLKGEMREVEYPANSRFILLRSYPLRSENEIVGGVSMITDITERKLAERKEFELAIERQRIEILSQFVRNAAHEFYTPLSTIETSLHLAENSQDEARRHRAYEKIRLQTQRITGLVDGMTTMMRLSTANTGARSPLDFPMLFDLVIENLQKVIEAKQLHVHCEIAPNLPVFHGVVQDLRGAFKHVLDNAIRHSPDNGNINIKIEAFEHAILIRIHNEGDAIPPADLERIFELFYRRDSARTTPGLGLGLSIARAIIEQQHSGHIYAESSSQDGTTIHIRLPIFGE
jgi:PAS domain S-box-containing protein